jgi:hypothetical protein
MPQNLQEQKNKTKKIFTYILSAMFAIIIAKWIILEFIPSSVPVVAQDVNVTTKESIKQLIIPKEVTLTIDFLPIQDKIEEEYESVKKEIESYIAEEIHKQQQRSYYALSKDDGFLDWIFGYFTGYEMMWKKLKGYFGSDDNEVKLVSDKFQSEVINPGLETSIKNIQSYSANRIEDYYKTMVTITAKYLNEQTLALKQQGYTDIQVEQKSIPWEKYIVSSSADGFALIELAGITGISVMVGKLVGGKVAAMLGPKVLGLITAKTASVVAGKIAASFSLIFVPLVDLAINEASKQIQYDKTKKEFEEMIDDILSDMQKNTETKVHKTLMEVKNSIYKELNKETKIKAVK